MIAAVIGVGGGLSMFGDGVFVEVVGVVGGGNVICVCNIICCRGVVQVSGKEDNFF